MIIREVDKKLTIIFRSCRFITCLAIMLDVPYIPNPGCILIIELQVVTHGTRLIKVISTLYILCPPQNYRRHKPIRPDPAGSQNKGNGNRYAGLAYTTRGIILLVYCCIPSFFVALWYLVRIPIKYFRLLLV